MSKKIRNFLAIVMACAMVVTMIPIGYVRAEESSASDTQQNEEKEVQDVQPESEQQGSAQQDTEPDAEKQEEAQQETSEINGTAVQQDTAKDEGPQELLVNYFYVESPYLDTSADASEETAESEENVEKVPGEERVAVSLGDGTENVTRMVLHYEGADGTEYEMSNYERTGELYKFTEKFDETQSGSYAFTSLDYYLDNEEEPHVIPFEDTGIEAKFGVNEKYEGIDESDDLTVAQADEIQVSVVELDGKSEEQIEEAVANATAETTAAVPNAASEYGISLMSEDDIATYAETGNKVIVLDPGHGGSDSGATGVNNVKEKDLTLKIAKYCKSELSQYAGVTVKMTRESDVYVGLSERVEIAESYGADLFVSIHLNASTNNSAYGAEVYYPNKNYNVAANQYASSTGSGVSTNILNQLTSLGLTSRGIKTKDSTNDEKYPDGSLADYYTVINESKRAGFAGIIVEHCFIDNESDYKNYLSSDDKLKKLGVADATGIAKYYGLSKFGASVSITEGTYKIATAVNTTKVITAASTSIANGTAISSQADVTASTQKFEFISLGDGSYKIEAEPSGLVLDVDNASTAEKTKVQLYSWNGSDAQRWRLYDAGNGYYYIRSELGTYLNMKDGTANNGNTIWMFSNDQTNACKWKLTMAGEQSVSNDTYYIKYAGDTSKALEIASASISNGGNAQIAAKADKASQRFELTYVGNGYYKILSENSGRALDVKDGNMNSGTNVQQWDYDGVRAQLWKLVKNSDGTYYIKSKLGTTLAVSSSNALCAAMAASSSQKWTFEKAESKNVSEGTYEIQTASDSNKVLAPSSSNIVLQNKSNSATQQYTVTYVSGGYYKIINKSTGKSLDIASGSANAGANLQEYQWNGSSAQLWKFIDAGSGSYYLKSKCGTYVDIANGTISNGTNIQMYSLNGTNAQKWKLNKILTTMTDTTVKDGTYVIQSELSSSKVVDVSGGSVSSGANIQLYQKNNTTAQVFSVTSLGSGYYKITSPLSGKVLDISGGSKASGANVQLYTWNGSDAQKWKFVSAGNGSYYLQSKLGTVLDISNAGTANGTNIQAFALNQTKAQKWTLTSYTVTSLASGTYTIKSAINSKKVVDVDNGSSANGANVQIFDTNGSNAQKFTITSLGDGYYKIASATTGKVLDVSGGSKSAGANVQMYTWNGTDAQKWKILHLGDGKYFIQSKLGTTLDLANAQTANRTNISAFTLNGTDAQKWTFTATTIYTPIMGTSLATVTQMAKLYKSTGYTYPYTLSNEAPTIEAFAQIYKEECAIEGVRADVAFCQAMLETGYLKFGGDVKASQYNFAGLGATGGVSGNSFATIRIGIRAQVQHLKAYASTEGLKQTCVDSRYQYVTKGSAPYVEWLGIKENPTGAGWATAANYGSHILTVMNNLSKY